MSKNTLLGTACFFSIDFRAGLILPREWTEEMYAKICACLCARRQVFWK